MEFLNRKGILQEFYSPELRHYADEDKVKGKRGVFFDERVRAQSDKRVGIPLDSVGAVGKAGVKSGAVEPVGVSYSPDNLDAFLGQIGSDEVVLNGCGGIIYVGR